MLRKPQQPLHLPSAALGGLFEGRVVPTHTAYGYSCRLDLLEPILEGE